MKTGELGLAVSVCVCETVCVKKRQATHSSVFSFFIPSHSLSFFCLTPFWVNHLKTEATQGGQRAAESGRGLRSGEGPYSQEILVSGLAELDEVGLDAVHPLVDLSVVRRLLLQVLLQPALAVHDLADPGLQLLVVPHYPGGRSRG